ncbi:gastrin/cholecystokinin type B receptor-like [Gigantopelta aegis]|uniref:gastrin/cholecystokinin type B receptor-like n=1 Tax=Gigantopelta aegis TaxID=1735272 RepID=UPI001B88B6A3|nr:gastrin/cholecystokinin type B receptor-like [Gigantopelta aegis]
METLNFTSLNGSDSTIVPGDVVNETSVTGSWNYSDIWDNTTSSTAPSAATDLDDFYDYDYDAAVSSIPLHEVIPVSLAYSITLVFGICGNFLVIFAVCRYRRLRSITNAFLTSLASADLLLVTICVPVKCAAFFSFTWAFGWFLCKFVFYMQTVSVLCSVMTLTVMSIERFIAIIFPLRAKSLCTGAHARIVIIVSWILSFFMATPILVGQKHKEVGDIRKAYWCVKEWSKPSLAIVFEVYMLVVIFVIPVLVMIMAYTAICVELFRMSKLRTGMGINKYVVIQMLILVVLLFIVCWGPILIDNLLVSVGLIEKLHIGYLKPMRQAFFLMSYMNSCVNPIVYGFMSKNFRDSFKEVIFSCLRRKERQRTFQKLNQNARCSRKARTPVSENRLTISNTQTTSLTSLTVPVHGYREPQ